MKRKEMAQIYIRKGIKVESYELMIFLTADKKTERDLNLIIEQQ